MTAAVIVAPTQSRARRIAFYVFTVVAALLFGGLFFGVPALISTWFAADPDGHRIHNLTHGITSGFLLTGAFLVLLRRPGEQVAAAQQAVIVTAFLIGSFVIGLLSGFGGGQAIIFVFLGLAVAFVAAPIALHPARAQLLDRGPTSAPLLALAAVAGIGAAYYAAQQLGLQYGSPAGEIHAKDFHYGGAASAALAIAAVGVIASLRTPGWRVSAWMAGIAAMLFGLAGMVYPDALSSLGQSAGAAAIIVGVAFIALTEREAGRR